MKTTLESAQSAQNSAVYDVIISGAGPVGLFLACELALAHCSVLLLEKAENPHSPFKQLPFGLRGLNAPSVEALYRRGLLEELEVPKRLKPSLAPATAESGKKPQGGGHFAGIPFSGGTIDTSQWTYRLPSSTDTQLFSEVAELETVLARRAAALGVVIRRGLALTDFQQTADGVTVQAGNLSFAGNWLVGCDGGRSAVRNRSSIPYPSSAGYCCTKRTTCGVPPASGCTTHW